MLRNLATLPLGSYLNDGHVKELYLSGLTDDTIRAARVFSATSRTTFRMLKYPVGPGLVFLYDDGYFRIKADHAQADGTKYRAPKDLPTRMYIPAMLDRSRLLDRNEPLIITEGEKKALRAVQDGFTCIAFGGVWNWTYNKAPIADFDAIPWQGRLVLIAFDSDVAFNQQIIEAPYRLAAELRRRGAWVWSVPIPSKVGEKVGLDDYLMRYGREQFREIEVHLFNPFLILNKSGQDKSEQNSGDRSSSPQNGNTTRTAEYLWQMINADGPLALDRLVHSPLDPNRKRKGTKFVLWQGEVRAVVERSPRHWPLVVFWYNLLLKAAQVGAHRRYKMEWLKDTWIRVWEGLLSIESGQAKCPYRSTLDGDAGVLHSAWLKTLWVRRQAFPDSPGFFDPKVFATLLQWSPTRVEKAWSAVEEAFAVALVGETDKTGLYAPLEEGTWTSDDAIAA
jgi:Domain of unknown function (DUF3854)